MHKAIVLLSALVLAGCLGDTPFDGAGSTITLSAPTPLTTEYGAFEPSLAIADDGTLYATAAPTNRPGPPDGRLASYLWHSQDDGATWSELQSPGNVHQRFLGLEGDIAVDAAGRLYFADVYLGDTNLHRWSPSSDGPQWDYSRPLATPIPVDDRPWLAAHDDGVVYLLLNSGQPFAAPQNLLDGDVEPASIWLMVSKDGGITWSPGYGFPGEAFCRPAASRAGATAIVVCHRGPDEPRVTVYRSDDHGDTWQSVYQAHLSHSWTFLTPGAAIDDGGVAYAAFIDDRVDFTGVQTVTWNGSEPGRIRYAAGNNGIDHDITPFQGRFGAMQATAGAAGTLALTFYATHDLEPSQNSSWIPYAMICANADSANPIWQTVPLLDGPAGVDAIPPRDFFAAAIGPDNALHAILQIDREADDVRDGPARGVPADLYHVRQMTGPNLD